MKMEESCPKKVENTVRKGEIARYDSVFKILVLQKRKDHGLFGKGLICRLLNLFPCKMELENFLTK